MKILYEESKETLSAARLCAVDQALVQADGPVSLPSVDALPACETPGPSCHREDPASAQDAPPREPRCDGQRAEGLCLPVLRSSERRGTADPTLPLPLPTLQTPNRLLSPGHFSAMNVLQLRLLGEHGAQQSLNVVVVQPLSHVRLFATPWTAALQASLSFPISLSLLKLMSIELATPFN